MKPSNFRPINPWPLLTSMPACGTVDLCLPCSPDLGPWIDEIGQVACWMEEHMVVLSVEAAHER